MKKRMLLGVTLLIGLTLAACGRQEKSVQGDETSKKARSESVAKRKLEAESRVKIAKKRAKLASVNSVSISARDSSKAASKNTVTQSSSASVSTAQSESSSADTVTSSHESTVSEGVKNEIKPVTKSEAIEAAFSVFKTDILVSHDATFVSRPDGSMTAHNYSGAKGEDNWEFIPNEDGTITVISKFGSVQGGAVQLEEHTVQRR